MKLLHEISNNNFEIDSIEDLIKRMYPYPLSY